MAKAIGLIFLLALTACSGMPAGQSYSDPCSGGRETTVACQDYRYSHGP